jgi:hypothetical protein
MTNSTTDPKREPGYRGSLPPRDDGLARPWILAVIGIFVLVIVLSVAGVPSRFIPDPTPFPTPSSTPVPSESPSAEPSESPEASVSASAEPPASADPSGDGSEAPSPTDQ